MIYTDLKDIPQQYYQIIYADPPWYYADKSLSHGGGAESHYSCLETDRICDLSIRNIATDDSVLLLWSTYPQLPEAIKVIGAWGFEYKTVAFTWIKLTQAGIPAMGMGRYTRSNPEIVLLGRRGKGLKRARANIMNPQFHKRLSHSEKPDLFRRLIVDLFGNTCRLELFARQEAPGWDAWGNEVGAGYQLEMQITDQTYRGKWEVAINE